MPTQLAPVITTAPFVDSRGYLTRVASGWLQSSYIRQGGESSATNTELAGGVAGNSDHISEVEAGLGQTNTTVAGLEAELSETQTAVVDLVDLLEALTTRVDTLETDLGALTTRVETLETTAAAQETRLAALEAWKTAMQAALPGAVSVNAVPALANDPATATLLENDLTANWHGTLNGNDSGVATAVNALRTALAA